MANIDEISKLSNEGKETYRRLLDINDEGGVGDFICKQIQISFDLHNTDVIEDSYRNITLEGFKPRTDYLCNGSFVIITFNNDVAATISDSYIYSSDDNGRINFKYKTCMLLKVSEHGLGMGSYPATFYFGEKQLNN